MTRTYKISETSLKDQAYNSLAEKKKKRYKLKALKP
jgi:hypothetical protein